MKTRTAVLSLLLATLLHVDWHVGRPPAYWQNSLGWSYHWILGAVGFAALALYIGLTDDDMPWRSFMTITAIAVIVGQLIEPFVELLLYGGPRHNIMPMLRWHVFLQFIVAGLVTGTVVLAIMRIRARAARAD